MAHRQEEKDQALVLLASNNFDFQAVEKLTGIPQPTLYRWDQEFRKEQNDNFDKTRLKKFNLELMLQEAISRLFEMMPDKWTGNSWAVALGILTDKLFLLNGQATSRTETIATKLGSMEPEKLQEIMDEAMAIVEEAQREKA